MDKDNSKRIKFTYLPFANKIMDVFISMQYSVSKQKRTIPLNGLLFEKSNYYGWLSKLFNSLDELKIKDIVEYKNEHLQELQKNPLLLGSIEVVEKAYQAKSIEDLEKIYDAYQELQKDYPFESHKQDYFDMGCSLSTGYLFKEDNVKLDYPATLFTAYTLHGGNENDDDIRYGKFYPVQKLSEDELNEIYEIDPSLIENNNNVLEIYNKMTNQKQ